MHALRKDASRGSERNRPVYLFFAFGTRGDVEVTHTLFIPLAFFLSTSCLREPHSPFVPFFHSRCSLWPERVPREEDAPRS